MPTISVIIPVYNEKETITEILRHVNEVDIDKEIIIVDDCSTDGSREIISSIHENNVKVIFNEQNNGKGSVLRQGIKAATGDIIIIQDADLEYNPSEYPKLIQPILDGYADVVYGSRFIGSSAHRVLYYWHYVGNKFLTLLSNMCTNLNLTDMETCYKTFRREIIQNIKLEENGFGFEPEVTAKIARTGCRVYEVGISYHGRTYKEGKKIGFKDGLVAVWCIVKYGLKRD